jgi:hypothetical protein
MIFIDAIKLKVENRDFKSRLFSINSFANILELLADGRICFFIKLSDATAITKTENPSVT